MDKQQAITILTRLIDTCVSRGNILTGVAEVSACMEALNTLTEKPAQPVTDGNSNRPSENE